MMIIGYDDGEGRVVETDGCMRVWVVAVCGMMVVAKVVCMANVQGEASPFGDRTTVTPRQLAFAGYP
jgi:hypothetical protein